jgi:hypothetical protein
MYGQQFHLIDHCGDCFCRPYGCLLPAFAGTAGLIATPVWRGGEARKQNSQQTNDLNFHVDCFSL